MIDWVTEHGLFLFVTGQRNDVRLLQISDPVSVLTTSTTSDVSFVKSCIVLEKKLELRRTSGEVLASIFAQIGQHELKPLSTIPNLVANISLPKVFKVNTIIINVVR